MDSTDTRSQLYRRSHAMIRLTSSVRSYTFFYLLLQKNGMLKMRPKTGC